MAIGTLPSTPTAAAKDDQTGNRWQFRATIAESVNLPLKRIIQNVYG
jgi:hypothetical protein